MQAPNLMMHADPEGLCVQRSDLALIEAPEATKTYCPLPHADFLNIVEEQLQQVGFQFGIAAHGLAHEGRRYFGIVHLLHESMNETHALVLGVRNSYDKSLPAGITFGSCVFVCDNLAFSGEVVVARKHTSRLMEDLPKLVGEAVSNTRVMSDVQDQRFEHYQKRTIESDKFAHDIICEMYRRGAVNTSRIGKVLDEYHEPSFDHGGRTAWRVFNAATEALKDAPLHDKPKRTIALQGLMDEVTNFKPRLRMEMS